jgi:hypothetical protein
MTTRTNIEKDEPINLTWSQELAASWSILWPCWVASFLLVGLIPSDRTQYLLRQNPGILPLIANLVVLFGQGILTFRLVRKQYRSFWIGVLHEGEPLKRRLALREQGRVSLQILLPHTAFLISASLLLYWVTHRISTETAQSLNSFVQLFRILVVGPAAIRWAMYANYGGFHLQAYRRKRKVDPHWSP